MDCSGGRAEAVEEVPERREETFSVGWFSGVGKRVIRSAEAGASEERAGGLGGVIFWRRYLPLVQTYCLRSIITIASAVRNIITANVIVTPANMLIIRSSIGSCG